MSLTRSWGIPAIRPPEERDVLWRTEPLPLPEGRTALPFGLGRSYGDSCSNRDGVLLQTRHLDHLIAFSPDARSVVCEAGVTLDEVLRLALPCGLFLPVVPGTSMVTVGGAIANDVHGKNHGRAGTFGRHVARLELLRSDGRRLLCSPHENADWFAATVGGLGLTGVILWAELLLKSVPGPLLREETVPFEGLDEYLRLAAAEGGPEHSIAWLDCLAPGERLPGVFIKSEHVASPARGAVREDPTLAVPADMPHWLLNRSSVGLYNRLRRLTQRPGTTLRGYRASLFPLDAILHWNRLYGRRGFYQYQCLIPKQNAAAGKAILAEAARFRRGAMLCTIKTFGASRSPGLLSFPREGFSIALDFRNDGQETLDLMERLDAVVREAGGSVYPAKDARMSAASFRRYFPAWEALSSFIDPRFSSDLWRRVTAPTGATA